jgi:Skp family chaperone for outer membrane proteins
MRITIIVILLMMSSAFTVEAQAPAQPAPLKIGAVNSAAFADATNGIRRLTTALRTLDNEFAPQRAEINRLVTRMDDLQRVPAGQTNVQLAARRDQAEVLQIEIRRKQEDGRTAYAKRYTTLIEPIRLSIFTALEAYSKQRGIDLLVDVAKFPDGVFLINQAADLTPGFIRDYNSRNP